MGLAERRAAKEFETNKFPDLKKAVDAAAGFDLPIEVDWESLAVNDYAHLYEDAWTKIYFTPLCDAFKNITVDQMGKDALKGALKKVIIKNRGGHYSAPSCYEFANGILTVDHEAASNVDNVSERSRELQKMLEAKL